MFDSLLTKLKHFFQDVLDFQSRIWVITISGGGLKEESFVINEDSFKEPLQWMKRKSYSEEMLQRVENMKLSQIQIFHVGDLEHRLLRVK